MSPELKQWLTGHTGRTASYAYDEQGGPAITVNLIDEKRFHVSRRICVRTLEAATIDILSYVEKQLISDLVLSPSVKASQQISRIVDAFFKGFAEGSIERKILYVYKTPVDSSGRGGNLQGSPLPPSHDQYTHMTYAFIKAADKPATVADSFFQSLHSQGAIP